MLLGVVGVVLYLFPGGVPAGGWSALLARGVDVRPLSVEPVKSWPPTEFMEECNWAHVVIDETGWSATRLPTYRDASDAWNNLAASDENSENELIVPVLPSVYRPDSIDKLFYDALLDSDIAPGDKVLVIGTGSGVDAWVASRKSETPIYIVEINPMAVLNARLTAKIAGFEIKPIVGDIRNVDLPVDFGNFDYVLWNMPFVEVDATMEKFEERNFHDGDNGTILVDFLTMLPSLLKEDGQAILLNYALAKKYIEKYTELPGVTTKVADEQAEISDTTYMLFVVPNPGQPNPESDDLSGDGK